MRRIKDKKVNMNKHLIIGSKLINRIYNYTGNRMRGYGVIKSIKYSTPNEWEYWYKRLYGEHHVNK